jgi:hypothetical protein
VRRPARRAAEGVGRIPYKLLETYKSMSDLSRIEKLKIEKLFDMDSGYVLDFSNRTFSEFIFENTGVEIYDSKYDHASGSKANRLRAFWQQESNHIVGQLLINLLVYWKARKQAGYAEITPTEHTLYDECNRIAERLKQDSPVEHIDVIQPNSDDRDFSLLAKSIRESIYENEPEVALDRLHTFVVKYVRQLCDKHGISYDKTKPLHSLFGEYVKYLRQNNLVKSQMTERILKASVSILEAFNDVRNNQSLAHDNPILNYNESILIFNNVTSAIKFLQSIEGETVANQPSRDSAAWDEIPF